MYLRVSTCPTGESSTFLTSLQAILNADAYLSAWLRNSPGIGSFSSESESMYSSEV